jgi:hypothetical protein
LVYCEQKGDDLCANGLHAAAVVGVVFRGKGKPPRLKPWEGPSADPTRRLPQHPTVAAERREEKQRYRLRKELREKEVAQLAATRDGAELSNARANAVG